MNSGGVAPPSFDKATSDASKVLMFLVRGNRLVEVERSLARPTPASVVDLLLEGPTQAEAAAGMRSAVAPGSGPRSVSVDRGIARVDLASAFVEVVGQEQILAVAQLVLTVTALPGVEGVRFALQGERIEVPRGDGTLVGEVLTEEDYASLRGVADGS